jgi:hypothetical protein
VDLPWLLGDAVHWTLTADTWQRVDEALRQLDDALDAGDQHRVDQCITVLLLAGPRRTGRGVDDSLDDPPRRPVPAQTRDLINRLVHRLGLPATPAGSTPAREDDATT